MAFEAKKYTDIFEGMRSRIMPVLDDFETGSVTRTLAESFSYELALLYEKMNLVYLSAFVDTAQGSHLDNVVAVLGLRRNLPDFSTGTVTFERDPGNEDIVIPIGTLVATEDLQEKPKKSYQTIEKKILPKDQVEIGVKVQAVERGEEQNAEAAAIIVMPRPVPGVKAVVNKEPVLLVGKRRETDDELRERAKNALISSGKATILSIENALLALPEVRDAKVRERFHFAEGEINITRADAAVAHSLPRGTQLSVTRPQGKFFYQTKDDVDFAAGVFLAEKVQVQSLVEGGAGELLVSDGAVLNFEDSSLPTMTATRAKDIALGEYGVIEVFVDVEDFDEELKSSLRAAIDGVRAAGIMSFLEQARKVNVDAAFRIEPSGQGNLTPENTAALEQQVAVSLTSFFAELRMGRPLLFSKLVKHTLSIEGVDNLANFRLETFKDLPGGGTKKNSYVFSNNKILVDEFEVLKAREICVAAEDKVLPVDIEFRALGITEATVFPALLAFFASKKMGDDVRRSEIAAQLTTDLAADFILESLKIKAKSWCERTVIKPDGSDDEVVDALFVEKPVLGSVFAYKEYLEVTGTVNFVLPLSFKQAEKEAAIARAETALVAYLSRLKAEEDLVFDDLEAVFLDIENVLAVEFDKSSFTTIVGGGDSQTLSAGDKKVEVGPFQKIRLKDFVLATDTASVTLNG